MADFIWQRLDGERTPAAIIAAIVEELRGRPEAGLADLDEFIDQLLANDLVERRDMIPPCHQATGLDDNRNSGKDVPERSKAGGSLSPAAWR